MDIAMSTTASTTQSLAEDLKALDSTDLYNGIYEYVQAYMSRYDISHDFDHILRVLNLAKHILSAELKSHPKSRLDAGAVVLAALLHDIGDKKYLQPGENAKDLINSVLDSNGCPPHLASKVALIVEHVSFSSEIKRPEIVKSMIVEHPELAIVQDADRLDAIGAVGIARTFAFGAAKMPGRGLQGCVEHFEEKLERLEGMMKTGTGQIMARERTRRLREFKGWWEEEVGTGMQA